MTTRCEMAAAADTQARVAAALEQARHSDLAARLRRCAQERCGWRWLAVLGAKFDRSLSLIAERRPQRGFSLFEINVVFHDDLQKPAYRKSGPPRYWPSWQMAGQRNLNSVVRVAHFSGLLPVIAWLRQAPPVGNRPLPDRPRKLAFNRQFHGHFDLIRDR